MSLENRNRDYKLLNNRESVFCLRYKQMIMISDSVRWIPSPNSLLVDIKGEPLRHTSIMAKHILSSETPVTLKTKGETEVSPPSGGFTMKNTPKQKTLFWRISRKTLKEAHSAI